MSKDQQPPPAYMPPQPPVYQNQPGYGPAPYQGYQGGQAPPAGYQAGAPPGYGPVPGYQAGAPPGYQPVPPNTTTHVYVQQAGRPGSCPACGVGVPTAEFTILGICLAILFFPIGVLCCLALTERRCSHCGMTYG